MNKKIKRIIAITLVLGAFSSVVPNKYFNILQTSKAYASSGDEYGIDDLVVNKGDSSSDNSDEDNSLTLYSDSDCSDFTSFGESDYTYYTKTSAPTVKIKVTKVNGYTYKIFKKGSSTAYSSSDDLDLKTGDNTFYVRTYETGDFDEKNIEKNEIRCYEVHVERKSGSDIYLKDISLSEGTISFSKNTLSYDVEVDSDIDEISIKAEPEDSDRTVKIDSSKVSSNNFRKNVTLNKGKNTIKIEVGDDSNNSKTYTLNIYRGTKPAASDSTVQYGPTDYSQPSVYLDNLQLDSGDISFDFKKNVSIYNVKVDSTIDSMVVTATPDDSEYKVEMNNKKLTSDKDYEATLTDLNTGENTFTIKVTDKDGNSRNYTLNIYRGVNIPTQGTTATTEVKANQWVQVAGRWQYNGKDGKPCKNQLLYDDNYKKTYYLNSEGFLDTGWQLLDGRYYYADGSGVIQKGWLNLGPNWYHLDANTGTMGTGWYKDEDKWYYLQTNGIMAHDMYIGEYRLGSDGAWIQ